MSESQAQSSGAGASPDFGLGTASAPVGVDLGLTPAEHDVLSAYLGPDAHVLGPRPRDEQAERAIGYGPVGTEHTEGVGPGTEPSLTNAPPDWRDFADAQRLHNMLLNTEPDSPEGRLVRDAGIAASGLPAAYEAAAKGQSYDPMDVTKGLLLRLPMETKAGDALNVFAGIGAKTADKGALDAARSMVNAGGSKLAEEAWRQHGWFKGADGQWRFEIPDTGSSLKGTPQTGKLGDILDHPELYKAYPGLTDVPVEVGALPGFKGSYDYGDKTLRLAPGAPDDMHSTLMHEIQHAIQHKETFARGGLPSEFLPPDFDQDYQMALARFKDTQSRLPDSSGEHQPARQALEDLRAQYRDAHKQYQNLAGEVEARNVQERMATGDYGTPPWQTTGYPTEPQTVWRNYLPSWSGRAGQEIPGSHGALELGDLDPKDQELLRRFFPGEAGEPPSTPGLPMDPESRMARAQAQGYTEPVYHGTKSRVDFGAFWPDSPADMGVHVGTSQAANDRLAPRGPSAPKIPYDTDTVPPNQLDSYMGRLENARVMPLLMRPGNVGELPDLNAWNSPESFFYRGMDPDTAPGPDYVDRKAPFGGSVRYYPPGGTNLPPGMWKELAQAALKHYGSGQTDPWQQEFRQIAKKYGIDTIKYRNRSEDPGSHSYMVLDPGNLRSTSAAFDPKRAGMNNLLYGAGAGAIAGPLALEGSKTDGR